ncbi:Hypothetical predicted protein [Mytilus galloprovincialis]|uniref:Uncharacterized protein n=1 Tax=Mytilus galloprovincialis TaxID=29158 RepID=A0A8B6FFQ8_MYTGA|nr:Hypothetical predicted protein [Mytilus galloprovincialis]
MFEAKIESRCEEDIREQAKEVLAALCGVVNKDELLELMNSMGMTKQFDTKEAEYSVGTYVDPLLKKDNSLILVEALLADSVRLRDSVSIVRCLPSMLCLYHPTKIKPQYLD